MSLFTLSVHKKKQIKKGRRVNPHKFWNVFLLGALIFFIVAVVGTTLFFVKTVAQLDSTVLPRLDTGVRPVDRIQQRIEKAEKAVAERVGRVNEN